MAQANPLPSPVDRERIYQWINELANEVTRGSAMMQLSRNMATIPDMGPILWHNYGTIVILIQEITNIYPNITSETLTFQQCERVSDAIDLLRIVALHPETRSAFIRANIPLYLAPFLRLNSQGPYEFIRVATLLTIADMVKTGDPEVISFFLSTEFIPVCLIMIESGSKMIKNVAMIILEKILLDENGLNYFCILPERFYQLTEILRNVVLYLIGDPFVRLLRSVVRCYLRLVDNDRARVELRQSLPDQLWDETFAGCLQQDRSAKLWHYQLLNTLDPTRYLAMMQSNDTE